MTPNDIFALVGAGVALLTVVGGIIARDRALNAMFASQLEAVRDEANRESKALHERINRIRDEYSRRTDLEAHMAAVQQSLQGLAGEVRTHTSETNKRLDALVSALLKNAQ